MLAGMFDPNVLKALGLQDGAPDVALARLWYERAAQLGSTDAPRRLQQLANRHEPEIRWNRINIDSGALRDRIG